MKIPDVFLFENVLFKISPGFKVVFPYLNWPLASGSSFYFNKLKEEA
jgi:hypothetical protein